MKTGDLATNLPCYMRVSPGGDGDVVEVYDGGNIFTVLEVDNQSVYYKVLATGDGKVGYINPLYLEVVE